MLLVSLLSIVPTIMQTDFKQPNIDKQIYKN